MTLPSWQDTKIGTKKRAALWLVVVVGEGNIFTKTELRNAFPDVAQIDRRMRDLRPHGWTIHTSREDSGLDAHEQRFVLQGEPVWEPGKASVTNNALSAAKRLEVIMQDGNMCRSCGITPGDSYEDSHKVAQLDIARRNVRRLDGKVVSELVTECTRCRVEGLQKTADLAETISEINGLGAYERKILANWMAVGTREFSTLETLWARYRTFPEESRAEIRKTLEEQM